MSEPAISIRGLGKRYRVNHAQERAPYRTLRDSLSRAAGAPLRRLRGETIGDVGDFWALRDVSFDVQPGEVVGVIGRNGAGKSTLLKILSRITKPTTGEVEINGRVGSLLEVGTGFHPELTGRENIFMNGSILGMSRCEIGRSFDAIVEFSGVQPFLEMPVKRYSSGMQVRLAFAVAAHLEPEILLVDEVLAVGDAEFQRKCIGRMREISSSGRTVFFVSHSMAAVTRLCDTAILLAEGVIQSMGKALPVVEEYASSVVATAGGLIDLRDHPARARGCVPLLTAIKFLNSRGDVTDGIASGEQLTIAISFEPVMPLERPEFGIGFDDALGQRIFSVATYLSDAAVAATRSPTTIHCTIAELNIAPGRYTLNLSAGTAGHYLLDALHNAVAIEVRASDFYSNGRAPTPGLGPMLVRSTWKAIHD